MSELEPTLTYSNHTATEVLRRMLDERGVEHYEHEAPATDCIAFFDGEGWHDCWESVDGEVNVTFSMTPEQAIAATLKQAVRHPKPHEKWTTVLLPEIAWSWDDSWPDYLSVAHDTHGEWRTYVPEATLGATDAKPTQVESSGTCHPFSCNCPNNCTNSERTETCHVTDNGPWGYPYVCSACGASFDPDVNNGEFNYCPNCGKRVVEPTTNDVGAEVDA